MAGSCHLRRRAGPMTASSRVALRKTPAIDSRNARHEQAELHHSRRPRAAWRNSCSCRAIVLVYRESSAEIYNGTTVCALRCSCDNAALKAASRSASANLSMKAIQGAAHASNCFHEASVLPPRSSLSML